VDALKFIDSFDESMNKKIEIERISQNLTICLILTKGSYENNHVGNWCSFARSRSWAIRDSDLY
jgi:hypothetical protein